MLASTVSGTSSRRLVDVVALLLPLLLVDVVALLMLLPLLVASLLVAEKSLRR